MEQSDCTVIDLGGERAKREFDGMLKLMGSETPIPNGIDLSDTNITVVAYAHGHHGPSGVKVRASLVFFNYDDGSGKVLGVIRLTEEQWTEIKRKCDDVFQSKSKALIEMVAREKT